MSGSVYGIKETEEALLAGVALRKAVKASLADGKIGIGDIPYLLDVIEPVKKAVEGGYKIPQEISDLEPGELDRLLAILRPLIEDVTPDELEPLLWKILSAVRMILEAVGILK